MRSLEGLEALEAASGPPAVSPRRRQRQRNEPPPSAHATAVEKKAAKTLRRQLRGKEQALAQLFRLHGGRLSAADLRGSLQGMGLHPAPEERMLRTLFPCFAKSGVMRPTDLRRWIGESLPSPRTSPTPPAWVAADRASPKAKVAPKRAIGVKLSKRLSPRRRREMAQPLQQRSFRRPGPVSRHGRAVRLPPTKTTQRKKTKKKELTATQLSQLQHEMMRDL